MIPSGEAGESMRLGDMIGWFGLDPADAAPEAIRGRVRAKQVYAVARLTPVIMAANALNAVAIVLVFHAAGEPVPPVAAWSAVALAAAAWFWAQSWRRRGRPFPAELGPSTTARVTRNAALLAAIWAFPSVTLMPGAAPLPQAFLVIIAGGMVSGGVTCFYPIPRAAAAYAGILSAGAIWGVAHASAEILVGGLMVLASYVLVVRRVIARHSEIFVSEIVARAELEEKSARIEALMAQTEARALTIAQESARRLERAQQMEALGQLTGGMAHDFNNILSVIRGNAELQMDQPGRDDGLIAEIVAATERGADVIQKLLAFSRRQSLRPEPVDVTTAVADMAGVLDRILSERVAIETRAAPGLWRARVDRAQLDAALLNLALNARDAMPSGGRLEIAAHNHSLDAPAAAALAERLAYEVAPGDYVAVTVRDEGEGMTPEVAARAFEPFFTTKPVGAGAGLGLSMVLGFIRQSGGFVTLDAEPGRGAAVALFLPRAADSPDAPAAADAGGGAPRGAGELLLLVEDRRDVRRTLAATVRSLGYRVAEAGSAAEARALIDEGLAPRMMVADVVLPGGESGVELAAHLAAARPGLATLLISGYPELLGEAGADDAAAPLLRKPFSRDALARAIRTALDG